MIKNNLFLLSSQGDGVSRKRLRKRKVKHLFRANVPSKLNCYAI